MNYYQNPTHLQPPPLPSTTAAATAATTTNQKHDIFVGNLAFSTTEEQIHQAFSELGRIVKIRMVTDIETGKPRGFAFVEFENAQDALSAIRNMNEYELNGRKIRVNFSNSSHLETLAEQLGMDMNSKASTKGNDSTAAGISTGGMGGVTTNAATSSSSSINPPPSSDIGTQAVAQALKSMSKGEMYDIISKLKEIADNDPDEARKVISGHPQLPEAILYCMSQLDMIKTPLNTSVIGTSAEAAGVSVGGLQGGGLPTMAPPTSMVPPPPPPTLVDPRTAAAATATIPPPPAVIPTTLPTDPRDPRTRVSDPRFAPPSTTTQPPPPPPQMYIPQQQQQQQSQPSSFMNVAGIDPTLAQQVMALTPAQISQLPVDKQNSILALRQQIQQGMGK